MRASRDKQGCEVETWTKVRGPERQGRVGKQKTKGKKKETVNIKREARGLST